LSERYEDLQAESLTLRQTNEEYKRTLAQKVKEILGLQREVEGIKKHYQQVIEESHGESEAKYSQISKIQ